MYYRKWIEIKPLLSLVPAVVFWAASMVFFVVGLKFEKPLVLMGRDLTMAIAIGLALANTIIQIIGNDAEEGKMGLPLMLGWYASYALGIGTNINGLLNIFNVQNQYLAWIIAGSLGTMIEVLPEKFLVQFLQSLGSQRPTVQKPQYPSGSLPKPQNPKPQYRPIRSDVRRAGEETPEWLRKAQS